MKEKINQFRNRSREEGLSLVEILVAITLLAVVSIMVVTLISSTMNSANRFSNVSSSQNEVSTAASNMQKDLSNAQRVIKATNNSVTVLVRQNSKDTEVTYYAYDPTVASTHPAGVVASKLPSYPALIAVRKTVSSGETGQTIIVKGLNLEGFNQATKHHMFDYYDNANTEVAVPDITSGTSATLNTLSKIKRVEFRIAAEASGRGTPIQVESSATVNSSQVSPNSGTPETYDSVPECPTGFRVTVDTANSPRTATLNWYAPSGATSYTIYRTNISSGVEENVTTVSDPTNTTLAVPNLLWGRTYSWNIQANGPGGNSPKCSPGTSITIIPEEIGFVNINSLAALTSTKSGAGAESLQRAADGGVPAASVTTQSIASGNRYTVARNLTNQLSWGVTDTATTNGYGIVGYNLYESSNLSTPVATVNSAGTSFTQVPSVYGNVKTYVVRAYNEGGESPVSFPVTLISPPNASGFTVADPDTSTRSTTTDSVITVTSRAANTVGFRVAKNENAVASTVNLCAPSTWSSTSSNINFADNDTQDANAAWGSTSCYRLTPFNDAGNGVASTRDVDHLPGKFTFTTITNPSIMRVIDTNRGLNGQLNAGLNLPYCWNDRNGNAGGSQDLNCKGGATQQADAYNPVGMFGSISNTYLDVNLVWTDSKYAYKDYVVTRERIWSDNKVDQNATVKSIHNAVYVGNDSQSLRFQNEQPGSVFEFTVTAKAENDKTRDRTTQHLTRPDIPHSFRSNYWVKDFGPYNGTKARTTVYLGAMRGGADKIISTFDMSGRLNNLEISSRNVTADYVDIDSSYQTIPGKNKRYVTTSITKNISVIDTSDASGQTRRTVSSTKESEDIGRVGEITGFRCWASDGNCSATNGVPFPDGWPLWWTGSPARYWSGGDAKAGSVVVGNRESVDAPGLGLGEGDSSNECGMLQEDTAGYTNSCALGNGIPPVPTITDSISGTSHVITWSQWTGITRYEVTTKIGGAAATTVTRTPTNRTVTITVPVGQSATVSVKAFNTANDVTATYTAVTTPAAPTNVAASPSGTSAVVSWTAVPNASTYRVEATKLGTSTPVTATSSGTTKTITGLTPGSTYQIRVVALSGTIESPKSAVVTVTLEGVPAVPATPTVTATSGTLTASWNGVAKADSYTVKYIKVTGAVTETTNVTTTNATITISEAGQYKVSVRANNSSGSSAYSAEATVTAPAPPALLGAPNGLNATVSGSSPYTLTVGWNAVSGATGYVIKYVTPGNQTVNLDVTGVSRAITNLPAGTYKYSMATKNANGTGSFSAVQTVVVAPASTPGPTVTNIDIYAEFAPFYYFDFNYQSAAANPSFTLIMWDSNQDVVYIDSITYSATSGKSTQFGPQLNPGKYTYKLYASNSSGGESEYSGSYTAP